MTEQLPIFISYKREDQDHAEELYQTLQEWGHDPWLDVKDIRPGISPESSTWVDAIDTGLKRSQVLVGLITPESLRSENVRNEWYWAKLAKRRILLMRLRPFDIEDMPHLFAATDYIDLHEDKAQGIRELQAELTQVTVARRDFKAEMTPPPVPETPPVPDYLLDQPKPKRQPFRLTLGFIGFIGVPIAFIWLVAEPGFEPLMTFLGAVGALLASFLGGKPGAETDLSDDNKLSDVEQMRKRVYQYWVQGVMQTALKEVESVGLGLNMQPEAVVRDGSRDIGEIPLPNDSRHVRQVYDTFKSFLILGDPGAGKTIMLLQLAESLILKPPPTHKNAIPLVLNLSSWSLDPKPLDEWLEDETWRTYRVRGGRIREWLRNDQLILLLDGLDEVKEEVRANCVAAINAFKDKTLGGYDYTPLVVCSRIKDYELLGEDARLELSGAIVLEALSKEQVDAYLNDPDLGHIKRVMAADTVLQAMATTPFLLNTMIYAYRHEPEAAITGFNSEAKRREHLFNTYVKRRLSDNPSPHDRQQTFKYLEWLATKMQAYVQTVFHPEDIGPHWMADTRYQFLNRLRLIRQLRLWLRGNLPFRTHRFLHMMSERQIMRQMGGGYIFIHRYLLENFAGVDEIYVLFDQLDDARTRERALAILTKLVEESPQAATRTIQEIIAWDKPDISFPQRHLGMQFLQEQGLELPDNRPGVGPRPDGIPDIAWSDVIPPGDYPIGGDNAAYSSLPAETYTLKYSYQIGKYPVTYAQFKTFLDDAEGYGSETYDWFAGLAATDANTQMREQRFKYANHPRENVSWYQAMAFCRWYSWRLTGEYPELDAIAQWPVRLPQEKEWEIAARGSKGLFYPYGNTFDATKANVRDTGIDQTSAVGMFPDGASWCGALDLSGNVWEWCLNPLGDPDGGLSLENARSNSRRVLRGGSWNYSRDLARAADRLNYLPNLRLNYYGFRLVRAPS